MKVSVIVVTLNEEKNISQCLESLLMQDIPKDDYEVLVVDGGSNDTTQELVKKAQEKYSDLKLFVKERGSITTCRNIGIKNAAHDFVAFTDADCIVPKDWLRRLKRAFSRHAVGNQQLAGVGGANIPPEDATSFQEAIGIAFTSFLGSLGSIQAQPTQRNKQVFSISCTNSLYKKKALIAVGMFSEELGNQGEDWDMGAKLKKNKYIVYGIHDSFVWHNFRATPATFWKNMVFYGDGRIRLMKKHPDLISTKYFVPLFFIPVFVLSAAAHFWTKNFWFLIPYLYFPMMFLYSLLISVRQRKAARTVHVFLAFLVQHFGYAWGELKGLRWFLK